MAFAIICTIAPGTLDTLKALRGQHLAYIQAHLDKILFGGPTRTPDGVPERMMIVLRIRDRAAAEAFIRAEPYTASGVVFSEVQVAPWSQVVPEPSPGALTAAIAAEQRLHPGKDFWPLGPRPTTTLVFLSSVCEWSAASREP